MYLRDVMLTIGLGLMAAATVQAADMKMDGMKMEESAKAQVGHTSGVVKEFDARKGTVTLAHDPVPAIQWPAMTMKFKINPELTTNIKVGQRVDFDFETMGMAAMITRIAPVR